MVFALASVGWIHRDLSSGNVYLFGKDEISLLLGDLEYAKRFTMNAAESPHNVRTVSASLNQGQSLNHIKGNPFILVHGD